MTNATKANVIALVNAFLFLLVAFNIPLTELQQGAIGGFVNAALVVWVGLTYTNSKKRVPSGMVVEEVEMPGENVPILVSDESSESE